MVYYITFAIELLYKIMNMKKQKYTKKQIAALAIEFDKSFQTIALWIKNGNDILTSDRAKKAINNIV